MPILTPYIPTPQENHENELWVKKECYRFYVEQRRLYCTYLQLLDLWLLAPYCGECILSEPFYNGGWPDITPNSWESDVFWELGEGVIEETKAELAEDPDFFYQCKGCWKELRPWHGNEVYVVSYHLEEHYGIPIETPGKKSPSKKLAREVIGLYDCRCFGCEADNKPLHVDHILPQSKGGDAAFRNLQPLCDECGNKKGNILPEEISIHSTMYFGRYPSDGYEGLFW